jgi:DNA-binding XRE family transcriptional regulator
MRAYRENFGLSPTELPQKLGTTGETIVQLECNQCDINQELAQKLSALFEVPIERFL